MDLLHFRLGENIGQTLLEIAQEYIEKGEIGRALSVYTDSLPGFTKEYIIDILKNTKVLIPSEDGVNVSLTDDKEAIKNNNYNIYDWKSIISSHLEDVLNTREAIILNRTEFVKFYSEDIENYNMIEMIKQYYTDDEMDVISGRMNIAARIIGSFDGKLRNNQLDNPQDKWNRLCDLIEYNNPDVHKWERILYHTVKHVNLIKQLFSEYKKFETAYFFFVENEFIEKFSKIELFMENTMKTLFKFADENKGYYHPLCDEGLYQYKDWLYGELLKTRAGLEYSQNGILKKDIMDGYEAGWLSPEGDFYGNDYSNLIHIEIADEISKGNSPIANKMFEDGVTEYGSESADYWLEKHGWMKIRNSEVYGSFIGYKNKPATEDYSYPYCPTKIQIKMICDYVDKYCDSKIYTQPQIVRRTEPVSTYKLKQMDDIQLHNIFEL